MTAPASTRVFVRTRRHLRAVTTLFTALHLSGCYTVQQHARFVGPVPDSVVLHEFSPPRVLHHVTTEGDVLTGWERTPAGDSTVVWVPLLRSERSFSAEKTIGAAFIVIGVGAILGHLASVGAALSDWDTSGEE